MKTLDGNVDSFINKSIRINNIMVIKSKLSIKEELNLCFPAKLE
jgi:hypothetical protein